MHQKLLKPFLVFLLTASLWSLVTVNPQLSAVYSISPLEQAKADYAYQVSKLSSTHDNFTNAKSRYLTYKTAVSKNEAFSKTKDYLIQIHNVYIAYLFLTEEKTNLFDWSLSTYKKDDIHNQLENEITYFNNSLENGKNLKTLEEVPPFNQNLQQHIENTTIPTVANIIRISNIAQTEDTYSTFVQTTQSVENYASSKINDSNKDFYLNWKSELEKIDNQLNDNILISKKALLRITTPKKFNENIATSNGNVGSAKQSFQRAKELFLEIIKVL